MADIPNAKPDTRALVWNPAVLTDVFALPTAVASTHIRLAGSAQLKVLLWLATAGHGTFDPAACSKAIGLSPADCADALLYWLDTGVLLPAGETAPAAPPTKPQPKPAATDRSASAQAAKTPVPPTDAAPAARPRPVKPVFDDVLKRQKSSPEFAHLLDTTSARFGRPITHADMETLLYLYDTAGIPAAVILMVVVYAVSLGKANMRYVETVALNWLDAGIDTVPAAEAHLCRLEKREEAARRVQTLLDSERPFTTGQKEIAEKWLYTWQMPDELIREADRLTREKTGKLNLKYMDRILEQWQLDGWDTLDKIRAAAAKKAAKRPAQSDPTHRSLDLDEYEKQVQQFVPVYPD